MIILFDLIQSMSKAEKRHFKMHSSVQGKENYYVQIFDYIESMKEYDEARLRQHFKGTEASRSFDVIKNYLYKKILDSLRDLDPTGIADNRSQMAQEYLSNALILAKKGLKKACEKELQKAEKAAKESESSYQIIRVLEAQRNLWVRKSYMDNTEEDLIAISNTIQDEFHKLFLTEQLTRFQHIIQYRSQNQLSLDTPDLKERANLELTNDKIPQSFYLQLCFYNTRCRYKFGIGDILGCCKDYESTIDLFHKDDANIRKFLKHYIEALGNYIIVLLALDDLDKAKEVLTLLQDKVPHFKPSINDIKYLEDYLRLQIAISKIRIAETECWLHHQIDEDLPIYISKELLYFENNISPYNLFYLLRFKSILLFCKKMFKQSSDTISSIFETSYYKSHILADPLLISIYLISLYYCHNHRFLQNEIVRLKRSSGDIAKNESMRIFFRELTKLTIVAQNAETAPSLSDALLTTLLKQDSSKGFYTFENILFFIKINK